MVGSFEMFHNHKMISGLLSTEIQKFITEYMYDLLFPVVLIFIILLCSFYLHIPTYIDVCTLLKNNIWAAAVLCVLTEISENAVFVYTQQTELLFTLKEEMVWIVKGFSYIIFGKYCPPRIYLKYFQRKSYIKELLECV